MTGRQAVIRAFKRLLEFVRRRVQECQALPYLGEHRVIPDVRRVPHLT